MPGFGFSVVRKGSLKVKESAKAFKGTLKKENFEKRW